MKNYYDTNVIQSEPVRPTGIKDEKYDLGMGRFCVYHGMCDEHIRFIHAAQVNKEFFRGNQWIIREDIDNFLTDDNNSSKNRIKVVQNKLIPIIAYYIGNARNLQLDYELMNISKDAITRRELQLGKLLFITALANEADDLYAAYLKENFPIGQTPEETQSLFDNTYIDEFTETVNSFDRILTEQLNLKGMQGDMAFDLSLTGLTGLQYDFYNGDFIVKQQDPMQFFFDHSANKRDLTDAMFQGTLEPVTPEYLAEKYQVDEDTIKALKEYINNESLASGGVKLRVPLVKVYWKDVDKRLFGWVRDVFGYPYLTEIKDSKEDGYTVDDLIPVDELTDSQKNIFKGKNSNYIYTDYIRYIHFVPYEYTGGQLKNGKQIKDIVLSRGVYKYQDTQVERIYNTQFPFKMGAWYYINREVFTPISALINPQRFINRMSSVIENIINTSLPKNLMYDPQMVDDESEFLNNIYQGKPNKVDTKGLGINNLVGNIGGGVDSEVSVLNSIMEIQSQMMDKMIGVNESLRGENQGANKLVGVTAMEIQRASLAQEIFYGTIADIFKMIHESIGNVARRVYSENERQLVNMVGDRGSTVIRLSKDYNYEDFRCYIKRVANPEQAVLMGQQRLLELYLQQVISKQLMAKYWDRPSEVNIGKAIREQAMLDIELGKIQQQQQQQQIQQAQEQQQSEIEVQEAREDAYMANENEQKNADREVEMARVENEVK